MPIAISVVLLRKVLRDYTFSDGTTIPAGATISTTSLAMHHDPKHYADPHTFNGFRFSSIREKMQGDESAKDMGDEKGSHLRFTGTDHHYLVFGGGRHVWCVLSLDIAPMLIRYSVALVASSQQCK